MILVVRRAPGIPLNWEESSLYHRDHHTCTYLTHNCCILPDSPRRHLHHGCKLAMGRSCTLNRQVMCLKVQSSLETEVSHSPDNMGS